MGEATKLTAPARVTVAVSSSRRASPRLRDLEYFAVAARGSVSGFRVR